MSSSSGRLAAKRGFSGTDARIVSEQTTEAERIPYLQIHFCWAFKNLTLVKLREAVAERGRARAPFLLHGVVLVVVEREVHDRHRAELLLVVRLLGSPHHRLQYRTPVSSIP